MIATPHLVRLVETGRFVLSGGSDDRAILRAPLEAATQFVLSCCATLNAMSPGISRDGDGESRIAAVGELMEAQLAALADIRTGLAEDDIGLIRRGLDKLETLHAPLMEALAALGEHERLTPQMSPLPAVDQCLKIGLNVYAGKVPSSALSQRLPLLAETMQNLRAQGLRCRALHDIPSDVCAAFDEQLQHMTAGLGALAMWLRQQEQRDVLMDALRLLRTSSIGLMQGLGRMDEVARRDVGQHKLLAAAELEHALHGLSSGRVTAAQVREASAALQSIAGYLCGQLDAMRAHPLLFSVQDAWNVAAARVQDLAQAASPWFQQIEQDAGSVAPDSVPPVAHLFEQASAAVAELQKQLAENARALAGASQIEQMVDLLGRLVAGGVTRDYVTERLTAFRDLQQDLLSQLQPGSDVYMTLHTQVAAIEDMSRYLDDPQLAWLQRGFVQLREIHPHMMELQQQMEASLRAAAAGQPEYTDIVGGEEPTMMPANLRRLQDIYDLYCAGDDIMHVHEELSVLQRRLQNLAADYEQRLGQRAERSSDALLSRQSVAFRSGLTQFVEAIEVMKQGVALANVDIIERGLNAGLAAGTAMQNAHSELMANLGQR
jgi:hypothetical protein